MERSRLLPASVGALLSAGALLGSAPPTAAAADGPMLTRSIYVTTLTLGDLHTRGCNLGNAVENNPGREDLLLILDFGAQYYSSSSGWMFTRFESASDRTDNWARDAVEAYSDGFFNCSGTDTTSVVTVGLGTNNSVTVNRDGGVALANRADRAAAYADNWSMAKSAS